MKDQNRREATGDLQDAFIEVRINPQHLQFQKNPKMRVDGNYLHFGNLQQDKGSKSPSKHWSSQANLVPDPARVDEPWVQKEDEQNIEPNRVISGPNGIIQRYQTKSNSPMNLKTLYSLNPPLAQSCTWSWVYLVFFHISPEQQEQHDPVEKKLYKRDFLLRLQFISPSLKKPDGLPRICGVVLEKVGGFSQAFLNDKMLPFDQILGLLTPG